MYYLKENIPFSLYKLWHIIWHKIVGHPIKLCLDISETEKQCIRCEKVFSNK